jgi:hypothetical protein
MKKKNFHFILRGNKECRCPVDFVEAGKIEISAIHDVDGPKLDEQLVEDVDLWPKSS